MENDKNKELKDVYMEWLKGIRENNNGQFLGDDYSNPYFTCIPDNWTDTDAIRILIVGEEAAGGWGRAKWGDNRINFDVTSNSRDERNIREMQDFCWKTLITNVEKLEDIARYTSSDGNEISKWNDVNKSAFWRRINDIYQNICESLQNNKILLGWTNQDLVYHKEHIKLTGNERTELHKVNCLEKVVNKLKPTIVLYCGWYTRSIKSEFDDAVTADGKKFYDKLKDEWKKSQNKKIAIVDDNKGVHHIFTYHPAYTRGYGKKKCLGYENRLIEIIGKLSSIRRNI